MITMLNLLILLEFIHLKIFANSTLYVYAIKYDSSIYCSSTTTYEMLGMQDIPNTYGDLSSEQGMMNFFYLNSCRKTVWRMHFFY
jgi:hypothetical protein